MDSSRVAVIVLNYKGIRDTIDCIASLSEQTYGKFTIVAVENGSGDDSVEKFNDLEKQYGDKLVALYNDKNLGFDGGVNTGIRWALDNDYDFVALLNNDAVAHKDWLKSLVIAAQRYESGITTSLFLHENGKTIDSTGDWYSKWGLPFPRNRNDDSSKAPRSGFVMGASGGASLYSVKMLREVALFDEDFFAYYEDIDISFRAQLAGWKVYYSQDAIAYHKQGATSDRMASGFTTYQTFKNIPLVYIKNVPLKLVFPIGIRLFPAYWLMAGNAIAKGRGVAVIKGIIMSFVLSVKKLPVRWRIQRMKKVPSSYIRDIIWDDLPPDQTGLRKLRKMFIGK